MVGFAAGFDATADVFPRLAGSRPDVGAAGARAARFGGAGASVLGAAVRFGDVFFFAIAGLGSIFAGRVAARFVFGAGDFLVTIAFRLVSPVDGRIVDETDWACQAD